jgi:hypothetical protein
MCGTSADIVPCRPTQEYATHGSFQRDSPHSERIGYSPAASLNFFSAEGSSANPYFAIRR